MVDGFKLIFNELNQLNDKHLPAFTTHHYLQQLLAYYYSFSYYQLLVSSSSLPLVIKHE